MKLKYIILLLLAFTINSQAQNYTWGMTYSMGLGVGEAHDYISNPAFAGFTLEGHKMIKPYFSIGIIAGWNIFNEKDINSTKVGTVTLTGEQARYLNIFPILANASFYYKNKNSKFVPFFRAHLGTYYILQRFDIGVYTIDNDNWHLGIAPEVGFMYKVSPEIDILVNGRYNYAFDSGTRFGGDENNDYSFFSINLGICYNPW